MIKFTEIYSLPMGYDPDLETVKSRYGLRSIYVNPKYIITMRPNTELQTKAKQKKLIKDLNEQTRFTRVSIASSGTSLISFDLVGDCDVISQDIKNKKADS